MAVAIEEIKAEEIEATLPKVCPTCGATRGGAAGAAHACSAVPTIVSKTGRGIVYAPHSRTCAECGGHDHRKLSRPERELICAWVQYSRGSSGGATDMNNVDPITVEEFAEHVRAHGIVKRAPAVRGRPATSKPAKTPKMKPAPVAKSVPEVKAEKPPAKPKLTKEEKAAARREKMKAELKGK